MKTTLDLLISPSSKIRFLRIFKKMIINLSILKNNLLKIFEIWAFWFQHVKFNFIFVVLGGCVCDLLSVEGRLLISQKL